MGWKELYVQNNKEKSLNEDDKKEDKEDNEEKEEQNSLPLMKKTAKESIIMRFRTSAKQGMGIGFLSRVKGMNTLRVKATTMKKRKALP
jgi:hypothetical protein